MVNVSLLVAEFVLDLEVVVGKSVFLVVVGDVVDIAVLVTTVVAGEAALLLEFVVGEYVLLATTAVDADVSALVADFTLVAGKTLLVEEVFSGASVDRAMPLVPKVVKGDALLDVDIVIGKPVGPSVSVIVDALALVDVTAGDDVLVLTLDLDLVIVLGDSDEVAPGVDCSLIDAFTVVS